MINLLTYDKKAEIRAGRANVIVLNYILFTLAAIAVLILLLAGAYLTLSVSRSEAQKRVDENDKGIAAYASVQKDAATFRSDIATAKLILDKEVAYSSLLLKIAKVVPSGVVLDSLSLNQTAIDKPLQLSAHAKDQATALSFKTSLEQQTALFSDVKFVSIEFATEIDKAHPVAITMSVIIKKEAL